MFSILYLAITALAANAICASYSHITTIIQDFEYESHKFNISSLNDRQYDHFQKLITANKELGDNPQTRVLLDSISQDINEICTQFGIPTKIEVFSNLFSGNYTMFSNNRKFNFMELQYFIKAITPHEGIKNIYIYPPKKLMIAYIPLLEEYYNNPKLCLEKKRPYGCLFIYTEKKGSIHWSHIYLYQGSLPPILQKIK